MSSFRYCVLIATAAASFAVAARHRKGDGTAASSAVQAPMRAADFFSGPTNSSAIVVDPSRRRIFVVNSDSATVTVIDSGTDRKVAEVSVGRNPRTLAVDPRSKRLFVANMLDDTVSVLSLESLKPVATIRTADEPYGIVLSPAAGLVFVACAGGDEIALIDSQSLKIVRHIAVDGNPRGLAVTGDGKRLIVTHFLTGRVSVIDVAKGKVVARISTGRSSNMAQNIVIHPRGNRAYLPHIRSNTSTRHMLFDTTVFPVVSVIDPVAQRQLRKETIGLDAVDRPVNMPFAAAISSDGGKLFVVNSGSDDLSVIDLKTGRGAGHVNVGGNPRGIAISADGKTAYVTNHVTNDVTVVDLKTLRVRKTIRVTTDKRPTSIKRGQRLFFTSARPEISRDRWISCASCHFDGHIDGRTWPTPRGPRNTQSLRAIGDTHPLHWSADRASVQEFQKTIKSDMAGTGLTPAELDDLAAFVNSIRLPPNPFRHPPGSLKGAVDRGRKVFLSTKTRCAECHSGAAFTDRKRHDVGTGGQPGEKLGPKFDTPSLRGLYASAPYLHDGRAATLREVLTTANSHDLHGVTAHLSKRQIDDLVHFLLAISTNRRSKSSRNDNRDGRSSNRSRADRRSVSASPEFRRAAVRKLPEMRTFRRKKSDRFLVDLDVVRLGHPYMGRNSSRPHTGGHVYFKSPAKPDPRKPSTYPAIYAVADGYVSRIDYSFKLREMYEPALKKRVANYRYGVTLAIARKDGGAVHFHYSIEPFVDPKDTHFYDRFLLVKPGQRVKKGDVIARMYIPPNKRLARKSHIHFNLMNTKTRRFMAPLIFNEKIVKRFRVTWGRFGTDGKTTIPPCMGYKLAPDENPFETGSN